jgi:putative tryptophan/tyrosine transport system substrate-binding protein
MKRREFIAGISAAAWPLGARAQQGDRVRRIGMLMAFDENDPAGKAFLSAFAQGLSTLARIIHDSTPFFISAQRARAFCLS